MIKNIPLVLFVFCIISCTSTIRQKDIKPLTSNVETVESEEEKSLIKRSNRLHQKFVEQGLIVRGEAANIYLNSIASSIAPTFNHKNISLNYYIIKNASINAFALPNGNIYINLGLITKLSSDDQLAFVVAHEIAHVVQRHGLKGLVDRKNTMVSSHVADLFLMGTGLIYWATITDLAAYSRGSEKKADEYAIKYLLNTDFDIHEGTEALKRLNEVKYQVEGASIWSTHPDTASRMDFIDENLTSLKWQYKSAKPENNGKQYEKFRHPFVEKVIKIRLRNKQFELAEDIAIAELERVPNQALFHHYLAEAQRLKGSELEAYSREYAWLHDRSNNKKLTIELKNKQPEFLVLANENYKKAQLLDRQLSLPYRGLGLLAMYEEDLALAKKLFYQYLQMDDITDRRYINSLLKNI